MGTGRTSIKETRRWRAIFEELIFTNKILVTNVTNQLIGVILQYCHQSIFYKKITKSALAHGSLRVEYKILLLSNF